MGDILQARLGDFGDGLWDKLEEIARQPPDRPKAEPPKPPSSHALAKLLLALPDGPVVVVKGEGGGYVSEWALHPGGPWVSMSEVRLMIERIEHTAAVSPGAAQ